MHSKPDTYNVELHGLLLSKRSLLEDLHIADRSAFSGDLRGITEKHDIDSVEFSDALREVIYKHFSKADRQRLFARLRYTRFERKQGKSRMLRVTPETADRVKELRTTLGFDSADELIDAMISENLNDPGTLADMGSEKIQVVPLRLQRQTPPKHEAWSFLQSLISQLPDAEKELALDAVREVFTDGEMVGQKQLSREEAMEQADLMGYRL